MYMYIYMYICIYIYALKNHDINVCRSRCIEGGDGERPA